MTYLIKISEEAEKELKFYKNSGNKQILKKISILLQDMAINPFEGIGKPEALKYNLIGKYSRRINKEHRIIYEVIDQMIIIYSVKGHY